MYKREEVDILFSYLSGGQLPLVAFIGVMFAFVATCFFIGKLGQYLPKDKVLLEMQ